MVWNDELEAELTTVSARLGGRKKRKLHSLEVSRVAQLDAVLLQDELLSLLRTQLDAATEHLPETWRSALGRFNPEVIAALKLLIWSFSVRINEPLPGDQLLNLRYRNEALFDKPHLRGLWYLPADAPTRLQRLGHGFGHVFVPMLWERAQEHALLNSWTSLEEDDWRRRVAEWMEKAERVYTVASAANLVVFLFEGTYRSVLERFLRLRVVPAQREAQLAVSFEFINQQLLYDGFSDLLMCLLPLIDWEGLRRRAASVWFAFEAVYTSFMKPWVRYLRKRFASIKRKVQKLHRRLVSKIAKQENGENETENETELKDEGFEILDDELTSSSSSSETEEKEEATKLICVSCGRDPPLMPFTTSCSHVYCYYCLKTLQITDKLQCVGCRAQITSSTRL